MIGSCHKHAWISTTSFIATVAILAATSGWGIALACASGMLGPVMAWNVDWVLTKRAYRRDLNHFTAFRVKAFASKMVFFWYLRDRNVELVTGKCHAICNRFHEFFYCGVYN